METHWIILFMYLQANAHYVFNIANILTFIMILLQYSQPLIKIKEKCSNIIKRIRIDI